MKTPPYHTIFPPEAEKYRSMIGVRQVFNGEMVLFNGRLTPKFKEGGITQLYEPPSGERLEAFNIITREARQKKEE